MNSIGFTDCVLEIQHWWYGGECITLPQGAVRTFIECGKLCASWDEVRAAL